MSCHLVVVQLDLHMYVCYDGQDWLVTGVVSYLLFEILAVLIIGWTKSTAELMDQSNRGATRTNALHAYPFCPALCVRSESTTKRRPESFALTKKVSK